METPTSRRIINGVLPAFHNVSREKVNGCESCKAVPPALYSSPINDHAPGAPRRPQLWGEERAFGKFI